MDFSIKNKAGEIFTITPTLIEGQGGTKPSVKLHFQYVCETTAQIKGGIIEVEGSHSELMRYVADEKSNRSNPTDVVRLYRRFECKRII